MKKDVETAVVGGVYRVPHVRSTISCPFARKGDWVPIYGPLHEDAEFIHFPEDHWHIDWRFLSQKNWLRVIRLTVDLMGAPVGYVHGKIISEKNTTRQVRMMRRECLREMPHHPNEDVECRGGRSNPATWLADLEKAMEGKRAKCGVCPHRGVKLGALKDKRGSLVCAAHGLTWSAKTGKLVRRTKEVGR